MVPDVNQIQHGPFWLRDDLLAFHAEHGIVTESWGPLGRGRGMLGAAPAVRSGRAHGMTPAQVVLRWHVQRGAVPIPKSATRNGWWRISPSSTS